ncbi:MAG TPA: type IV secretory system conjugative DNA transfer family protein [Thermoanaerobaculia bacterium]|nr:type IV secretory system conjugative DNA transfer family protein [Thermoanaerobaculia bacterium]
MSIPRALLLPPTRALGCLVAGVLLLAAVCIPLALAAHRERQALLCTLVIGACLAALYLGAEAEAVWGARGADSHGSARWGDPRRYVVAAGPILGRAGRSLLRYEAEGHILTVAPTGSGKGVSAVIPNLLDYPGSVLVLDLKGENHAVTAARRARFGPVLVLDPFRITGAETAAVNPLDLLDPDSELCDADAATLAHLLVLPATEGDTAFWEDEAAALLAGLLLYVAALEPEDRRHLGTVRQLLTLAPADWQKLLLDMAASDRAHGLIARAANRLSQKADRERSGVVSTAQRHTHFLDSPAILRTLATGPATFDLAALKTQTLSVYCALPPERLASHGRWLRLLAGAAVHAMLRTPGLPQHRVLMLLDEFAQLGHLQPVEQALTLLRGYGVRLWLLCQDLAQLRAAYRTMSDSLLANAAVLQAFGTNDLATADYLSRRTGQATVLAAGENRSSGQSFGQAWLPTRQSGLNLSASETGRPLLLPDEILRLDPAEQLLLIAGREPLLVERVNYLRDPEFLGAYAPNSLHKPLPGAIS